jgi:hypothetical protein
MRRSRLRASNRQIRCQLKRRQAVWEGRSRFYETSYDSEQSYKPFPPADERLQDAGRVVPSSGCHAVARMGRRRSARQNSECSTKHIGNARAEAEPLSRNPLEGAMNRHAVRQPATIAGSLPGDRPGPPGPRRSRHAGRNSPPMATALIDPMHHRLTLANTVPHLLAR